MRGAKSRPQLSPDRWPLADRAAREKAFERGDIFDESGAAAHLAEATKSGLDYTYGCFLGFIRTEEPRLLDRSPAERTTPEIIARYVAYLRKTCRDTTVASDLHKLRQMLTILSPDTDWSWLLRITKRIQYKAKPLPRVNSLVTSDRLFDLGLRLMDAAVLAGNSGDRPTKEQALQYRDGFAIALLALVAPRRRTLAALRIGKQLVRAGKNWALAIPAEDMKNKRADEYCLPEALSARVDEYLSRFRNVFPGASTHDGVWISQKSGRLTGGAIYDAVRRRTLTEFGFAVNLHGFRRAAATTWAIEDPANVCGVSDLLGHARFGTSEGYYIAARTRAAGGRLAAMVKNLKRASGSARGEATRPRK
jgi:integrase/recombinase XerD